MDPLSAWLEGLGLAQYARVFAENGVDLEALPLLSDRDLERLGVLLGHRRRLLKAIAELAPSSAATPVFEAERRQLTVMFCDLVGSTALSARLDPEDLRAVIGAYHRGVAAVIERAGGFVAKYMGDGVLAYFGYPRADEHDPERAVRAGLALVELVAGLDTAVGTPLQARVGITTGLVVVGDLIGEGEARERGVIGETPNLAARLQALAEPGAVVISASTRRLTGGLFDYEDLGAVEIKGLVEPVAASRVLRESGAESRVEALRATATPLVGRDEELALLQRRWQQAASGEGYVVLVSGEPGIGKSRLAQTLVDRLAGEPHTRLRLFCSPHHQVSALYPTITQLQRAAGFRREDTADERLDKLGAVLGQATNDVGEAAPLLAALLSLPAGERYPPLDLTPQKQKEKTLQASLLARLDRLAPEREVAQIGAALGRQFSHELIGAVAAMPPAQLDNALAQLVGADLIYRRGTPPDAEYTFKHALVQDAAYSTLLRERRRQLHARIAATLEDRFPEIVAAQPALLAHHSTEAVLSEKAVDYWLAAGRQAWGRSAAAEAVALLRRALVLVPALPDNDRRRQREFDLQISLAQVLIASRSWGAPEVGEAYARAQQLAAALDRPRAAGPCTASLPPTSADPIWSERASLLRRSETSARPAGMSPPGCWVTKRPPIRLSFSATLLRLGPTPRKVLLFMTRRTARSMPRFCPSTWGSCCWIIQRSHWPVSDMSISPGGAPTPQWPRRAGSPIPSLWSTRCRGLPWQAGAWAQHPTGCWHWPTSFWLFRQSTDSHTIGPPPL
jgi:class 3 adenylate cyclase